MTELDGTWAEVRRRLNDYVRARVDENASEDLVHDILLKVLQNEEKLRDTENPLAWIYTVARNSLTDYYRKQARKLEQNDPSRINDEEAAYRSMPDCVDHDFANWLQPIVQQLETPYRDALLEVDFQQQKQADVAEAAGVSLSAMKSRVQRARTQLKSELLACCSFEVDRFGKPIDYEKKRGVSKDSCC